MSWSMTDWTDLLTAMRSIGLDIVEVNRRTGMIVAKIPNYGGLKPTQSE